MREPTGIHGVFSLSIDNNGINIVMLNYGNIV